MATVEVKAPEFSESVDEGTLLNWKKRPGDRVDVDDVLVEIETDKVVLEVVAGAAGVLRKVLLDDGETVTRNQVIATIEVDERAGFHAPADLSDSDGQRATSATHARAVADPWPPEAASERVSASDPNLAQEELASGSASPSQSAEIHETLQEAAHASGAMRPRNANPKMRALSASSALVAASIGGLLVGLDLLTFKQVAPYVAIASFVAPMVTYGLAKLSQRSAAKTSRRLD